MTELDGKATGWKAFFDNGAWLEQGSAKPTPKKKPAAKSKASKKKAPAKKKPVKKV